MKWKGHLSKRYTLIAGTGFLLLFLSSLPLTAQEKQSSEEAPVPNVVRVKIAREFFKEGITPAFFGEKAERFGITEITPWLNPTLLRYMDRKAGLYNRKSLPNGNLGGQIGETSGQNLMRIMVVKFSSNDSPQSVARALAAVGGVEYAEPIWNPQLLYVPNDPKVQDQTQWHLEKINAYDAWDEVRADSSIVIAIVDTGIEPEHSDLKAAIWHNPGESGNGKETNGVDDDGNGYIDDWWGYDFGGSDGNSPDNDPHPGSEDHGVHVAGIAGATGDNDIYGAGVAFGVKLMAVKISNDGAQLPKGYEGIVYAAAMGARIINCSWGDTQGSQAQEDLIREVTKQDVLIVAAAGNDTAEKIRYPARYKGVLSVAATRSNDSKRPDSDYHYNIVMSAPGDNISSTRAGNAFNALGGTSMASPMVAGAAALLLKKDPTLTGEQMMEILRATADNLDLGLGQFAGKMGSGRLNVARAVEKMKSFASARMTNYVIEEEKPDGIFDPGERITVRATVKNILAPSSGVTSIMSAVEPAALAIDGAQVEFGAMATGDTAQTGEEVFHLTIPSNAAPDSRIVLKVTTSTEDRQNNDYIVLPVFPTVGTTDLNNISASFNSVGNVGYNGTNREQGTGFRIDNTISLLWHGGLMIGTSQNTLLDVVRRGASGLGTNNGFLMLTPYRLEQDAGKKVEIGRASFTDRDNLIGLNVDMTTYEYKDDSDYVLALYKVTNTSGGTIQNLHCGLYLDWDLESTGTNDQASYDPGHKMGFVRNATNLDLLVGAALLSDQTPDYHAVDNPDEPVATDFTNEMKWNMLSRGVSKANTDVNTDISMVIGGGPVTIAAGASETFVFGLMGATNFQALQRTAERAHDRMLQLSAPSGSKDLANLILTGTAPNPFSDATTLSIDMPAAEQIRLEVFNASGERVRTIYEGRLTAGHHSFEFNREELPTGVYFYRLEGEKMTARGSMVLER